MAWYTDPETGMKYEKIIKTEKIAESRTEAVKILKEQGFEHMLHNWEEDESRMVLAGTDWDTEVFITEDGNGIFDMIFLG